jgi:predicted nucleic acid-binding protein
LVSAFVVSLIDSASTRPKSSASAFSVWHRAGTIGVVVVSKYYKTFTNLFKLEINLRVDAPVVVKTVVLVPETEDTILVTTENYNQFQ